MSDQLKKFSNSEDTDLLTEDKKEVKEPKMYRVILLNDDYTPMDFVIWLLESVFFKNKEEATRLMLDVHQKGQGTCGLFPYDLARTKVMQVKDLSRKHEHPLECVMEEG